MARLKARQPPKANVRKPPVDPRVILALDSVQDAIPASNGDVAIVGTRDGRQIVVQVDARALERLIALLERAHHTRRRWK